MPAGELQYDPTRDYSRPAPIPADKYVLELQGSSGDWHTGPSGYETIGAFLRVSGGEYNGRGVFCNLSLSPKAFLTLMFVQACGVTTGGPINKDTITQLLLTQKGRKLEATVGVRPAGNGFPERNEIKGFEPDPDVAAMQKKNGASGANGANGHG